MSTAWNMNGILLGACSCDWGCPCSFDAPPTQGFCEGGYTWIVENGKVGDTSLDGLSFSWFGHSPGPLHKGDVTWEIFADERANPAQRAALAKLWEGKSGGPWMIFTAVMGKLAGVRYLPFEVKVNGLGSVAKAGEALQVELGPILNPVTGAAEELYLEKPTGFTSKRLTLGAAKVLRVNSQLKYDHSGKYGEFSEFAYEGQIGS